jgi:hypothetical protein
VSVVKRRSGFQRAFLLFSTLALLLVVPLEAAAYAPGNEHFQHTWERTDRPVKQGFVERSWIWGEEAFTPSCDEPYLDSPDSFRETQYFDKSRMEINDPEASPDNLWFTTQGRLGYEMISGDMQVGDAAFVHWGAAGVHVAGDPDPEAPTYADLAGLMELDPQPVGQAIIATLGSDGQVGANQDLAVYGVTAAEYVPATNHTIASVFWAFMTSQGLIYEDGGTVIGPIFENPYYGVGYPLSGAFWVRVKVRGVEQDVLVQAFERRVLTYTPGNDEKWRVEAGNTGQHYFLWRYGGTWIEGELDCPRTTAVTFNVYEPRDSGGWEHIAVTVTSEVFHPGDVATGVWRSFTGATPQGESFNSAGTLVADHTYGGVGLKHLEADIVQLEGPTAGTAQVVFTDFSLGFDARFPTQPLVLKGTGSISYDAEGEQGMVELEVIGTAADVFHVFLTGPAPPVFFGTP